MKKVKDIQESERANLAPIYLIGKDYEKVVCIYDKKKLEGRSFKMLQAISEVVEYKYNIPLIKTNGTETSGCMYEYCTGFKSLLSKDSYRHNKHNRIIDEVPNHTYMILFKQGKMFLSQQTYEQYKSSEDHTEIDGTYDEYDVCENIPEIAETIAKAYTADEDIKSAEIHANRLRFAMDLSDDIYLNLSHFLKPGDPNYDKYYKAELNKEIRYNAEWLEQSVDNDKFFNKLIKIADSINFKYDIWKLW